MSGGEGNKGRGTLKITKCTHGHTKRKKKKTSVIHTRIYTRSRRNGNSKNTRVIISAVFEVLDYNHLILICCLLPREKKKKKKKKKKKREGERERGERWREKERQRRKKKKRGKHGEMEEMRKKGNGTAVSETAL